jgi:hypothetical protein
VMAIASAKPPARTKRRAVIEEVVIRSILRRWEPSAEILRGRCGMCLRRKRKKLGRTAAPQLRFGYPSTGSS